MTEFSIKKDLHGLRASIHDRKHGTTLHLQLNNGEILAMIQDKHGITSCEAGTPDLLIGAIKSLEEWEKAEVADNE